MGKRDAHELVERASRAAVQSRRPLREIVGEMPEITHHLDGAALDRLFEPSAATGCASVFIDRVLAARLPDPRNP